MQSRAGYPYILSLCPPCWQAYKDDGVAATEEAVARLHTILVALPAPAAGDAASRDAMLHAASAWAEAAIAWASR